MLGLALIGLAIAIPLARAPERAVESLVARWAPAPSQFEQFGDQLVHFRDEGPRSAGKTPVLLLHDAGGSLHQWDGWLPALARSERVIRLDLPGHGLSGPPARTMTPANYLPASTAQWLASWLAHRGIRAVQIVGSGHGALVGLELAAQTNIGVTALALIAPPASPAPMGQAEPVGWQLMRLAPLRWASGSLMPRQLVALSLRAGYADPAALGAPTTDRYFELTSREGNREALAQWLDARSLPSYTRVSSAPALPQRLPLLLAWGASDALRRRGDDAAWKALWPGAEQIIWPALGHLAVEEAPQATLASVQAWLDGPAAAGPR